jgi:hypothetical protein
LPPVTKHGLPSSFGAFDGNRLHIAFTTNIGDQDKVEVGVAINGEMDPSTPLARSPAITESEKK